MTIPTEIHILLAEERLNIARERLESAGVGAELRRGELGTLQRINSEPHEEPAPKPVNHRPEG